MRIPPVTIVRPAAHRPAGGRRLAWIALGSLTLLAAVFGATTGTFVRLDMPDLRALEDLAPPLMTRIRARDASVIGSFATERRILLGFDEIPQSFRQAVIASEDSRFDTHGGIDLVGGMRAVWNGVREGRITQGASTLTMQLAGNLFLDRSQRTLRRKLQEAALALAIERRFSKQEILRMYANQVYFGHGLYGLEAASRFYFDKPARELTVGESATLVGLLPRPAGYSPYRDPERARERRDLVLGRMVTEGTLGSAEAARIAAEAIVVAPRDGSPELAPYFVEEARRWLQQRYGAGLYNGGLSVDTTLDPSLQRRAESAVDRGLRRLDKRQGWRSDAVRRVPSGDDPQDWTSPAWTIPVEPGRVTDGVVLSVDSGRAVLRVAGDTGELTSANIRWTGTERPDRLLAVGDVIRVRVLGTGADGRLRLDLEQEPRAEAALVAIDPRTGEILALVGGHDFSRSEYDRAMQARRQPGSLFKPFVYAAALERGWTLGDTLVDEPTVFLDRANPVPYQPENFSRRYYGRITLRTALERSVNIATVKLLEQVGYDPVIETARRLGVTSRLRPYPSLALGAFELSLLEVTSAYGAFANQGLWMEPYAVKQVTDRTGRVIFREKQRVREAVSPQVAHLMNRALEGVILHGTARAAGEVLPYALAGKTGTTDDYTDAWFVGYSPELVVGVWVGHDDRRGLGNGETGARAALPIWIDFMQHALAASSPGIFPVPAGIRRLAVDPHTGRPAVAGCADRIVEVFIQGTEPAEPCADSWHRRSSLPYPFHRFPLEADGSIRIPRGELQALVASEPTVLYDHETGLLEAFGPEAFARIPVTVLPTGETPPDAGPGEGRTGVDGRPARVVWFERAPRPSEVSRLD